MRYLLDTNVFREVQKGPAGHVNVRAWLASVDDADLRLSVMTVTEVRRGIVRLAKRKTEAARELAERFYGGGWCSWTGRSPTSGRVSRASVTSTETTWRSWRRRGSTT